MWCLLVGELSCYGTKEDRIRSKVRIASVNSSGLWASQVLKALRYCSLKSGLILSSLELHFLVWTIILNAISCLAPQYGLSADVKNIFYVQVCCLVTDIPDKKMLLLGKYLNGRVTEHTVGFEDTRKVHRYVFKPTLQLPAFSCTRIPAG